jgi:hypothetical protein
MAMFVRNGLSARRPIDQKNLELADGFFKTRMHDGPGFGAWGEPVPGPPLLMRMRVSGWGQPRKLYETKKDMPDAIVLRCRVAPKVNLQAASFRHPLIYLNARRSERF